MGNFIGEYNYTIDAKGRLPLPPKFRERLGAVCYVAKGFDECLYVYAEEDWEAFSAKLRSLPVMDTKLRKFVRSFLAGTHEVEPDKQGRILIPQLQRERASLEKEVVVAGVGDRVEIWDKAKWLDNSEYDLGEIEAQMLSMNLQI